MSMSKTERDEIRKKLATLKFKSSEKRIEDIRWLLAKITPLLADSEAANHQFEVIDLPGPAGQKKLVALTDEMASLFISMCRTYGTVTWKLMQDLTNDENGMNKTQKPGGGVFMLSEALPLELRPYSFGNQPKALPRDEPDGMNPNV